MEDLVIRVLQGLASAEEEERLREWRARAPENERRYREIADVWSVTAAAAPVRLVPSLPLVDDIVNRAEHRNDVRAEPAASGRRGARWHSATRRASRILAAAAALAVVGVGGSALLGGLGQTAEPVSLGAVTTGAGESVTLTLEDGTAIRVGPQSTLRLTQVGDNQEAYLEGRAFFGVDRDSTRTFTVRTEFGDATVLGTRFEVRSEERDFRVLVVEGSVRVSAADSSFELRRGLLSESIDGAPPVTRAVVDTEEHLSWMGRSLVFQGTPLSDAIAEIESRYAVSIDLADPALADLTVTAAFTDRPVDEVVVVLCATVGAECSVDPEGIRIGGSATATTRP